MRKTGILVLALLVSLAASLSATPAGTMGLSWNPVSDTDLAGYKVYLGTSPGIYELAPVDVGNQTSATVSGLDACTRYYTAVKAYDTGGLESDLHSNEVAGLPRPVVGSTSPGSGDQGQSVTVTIFGESFDTTPTVEFSGGGITVDSVQYVSCTEIKADITIAAGAATGARDVTVVNPDSSFGTLTGAFTVAAPVAPTVSSTSPADGATDVAVTAQPTVTFSAAMDPATITTGNVRLLDDAGQPVAQAAGSPQLSTDGLTATITPSANLSNDGTYQIHVRGGSGGVQDTSGTTMAADYQQNPGFTTVQAADNQPPSVSSTTPADAAIDVPVSAQPQVVFDEAVDAATVTAGTVILLDDAGQPVAQAAGSPQLSADGLTATIVPTNDLNENAVYKIRVLGGSGGVADLAGNPMTATFEQAVGFTAENLPPGTVTNYRRSDVR